MDLCAGMSHSEILVTDPPTSCRCINGDDAEPKQESNRNQCEYVEDETKLTRRGDKCQSEFESRQECAHTES
jgi:hypothetical protein